ncbi:ANK [Seminavis robusta]|uniref:ANK n=1 Tax=Seminavis robusta TaxID=568900 RepID=A0A9N8E799_9STRA|nr:ANK [Seminavis robusta]|eukprot:Sro624_g177370.1 ANK (381) ;mRNA; f:37651-39062
MTATIEPNARPTGSRIPLALQAVFLASNRGKDVSRPPPDKQATKTYFRGWMFQGLRKKKKKGGSISSRRSKGTPQEDKTVSVTTRDSTKPPTVVQFGSDPSFTADSSRRDKLGKSNKMGSSSQLSVGAPPPKPKPAGRPPMSPQAYLDVLIHSRGYSTRRYRTLQTGYYSKPTAFQQASYNVYLVKLVRANDIENLRAVIQAGISPNPCNAYGESLVHMVARRGDFELLRMLLDVGTSIQVSDDYGRTPLHDACWAAKPSFETVELIADKDIALFHMTDSRGAVPLSYVRREHWPLWIEFLESKKDLWWPPKTEEDKPAPLIDVAPNECPIPEPENALSIELAGMVASESSSDDDDLAGFSADDMANMLSRVQQSKARVQ